MGHRIPTFIFTLLILLVSTFGQAQDIGPQNGTHDPKNTIYALTNCKLVVNADLTIPLGMLVVQNGVIQYAGITGVPPKNAVKIDMKGYTIYPSFIDMYSGDGQPKAQPRKKDRGPQMTTLKEGPYYWNESVHPETNGYETFSSKHFKNKNALVQQGFGVVATHQEDGVVRGTSALVSLSDHPTVENIIRPEVASHHSFQRGATKQSYPSSQMGAIALIRQFYLDCVWYNSLSNRTKTNISLQAGIDNSDLPQIFLSNNKLEILRIAKIAREFKMNYIVKGSGDEFERAHEIRASGAKLILPVNFPKAYDVTDPFLARFITLSELKEWELRPYNPYYMYRTGVEFAFTTHGLKNKKDFLKNVKKAIRHGLPKEEALRALTENPAKFLKMDTLVGSLKKGKLANFLVVKGDIFEGGEIYENWMMGDRKIIKDVTMPDIRGPYDLNINKMVYKLNINGSQEKPRANLTSFKIVSNESGSRMDTIKTKVDMEMDGLQVSMSFVLHDANFDGLIQLNGTYNDKLGVLHGKAQLENGYWVDWNAIRAGKRKEKKNKSEIVVDTSMVQRVSYPNIAYGFDTLPKTGSYFIKNATIWTNTEQGIIKDGSILIRDGKIKSVNSRQTSIGGAKVIDAKGKHVTCGIIDEHSHIAISNGVNEGGQAISAEVSIGDVVRSDDINIYRALSGGVTAAQLLHGSANPIGGQSALVKLKWGFSPEEMLIDSAAGFIKFALGENVKQSNWGDMQTVRYPQTRMGVEQVFYDAFIRAREYKEAWADYINKPRWKRDSLDAPRRDLELEVLLQILEKKRFISCHSYVQSEINMLMTVADSMGFTLNTFTHILEGYKVADKMKEHGAGGSTFSDWWAYKYEVNEAIPYNAAILHKMGVVTAINSDDAEMIRRLNQEAAKAVKYGGVSQEDAWKMVTLNPAKLLHLDDRMGSLEVGKDADVVIWSDNPLTITAKVEKTFVDGMLLYDRTRTYRLNQRDALERKRIMQKMIEAKKNGEPTQKPNPKKRILYHCDTMGDGEFETEEHHHEH